MVSSESTDLNNAFTHKYIQYTRCLLLGIEAAVFRYSVSRRYHETLKSWRQIIFYHDFAHSIVFGCSKLLKFLPVELICVFPIIIQLLDVCVTSSEAGGQVLSGPLLVTELGEMVDIVKLLQMSWEDRLRVSQTSNRYRLLHGSISYLEVKLYVCICMLRIAILYFHQSMGVLIYGQRQQGAVRASTQAIS